MGGRIPSSGARASCERFPVPTEGGLDRGQSCKARWATPLEEAGGAKPAGLVNQRAIAGIPAAAPGSRGSGRCRPHVAVVGVGHHLHPRRGARGDAPDLRRSVLPELSKCARANQHNLDSMHPPPTPNEDRGRGTLAQAWPAGLVKAVFASECCPAESVIRRSPCAGAWASPAPARAAAGPACDRGRSASRALGAAQSSSVPPSDSRA
jgi:hypothetical protein